MANMSGDKTVTTSATPEVVAFANQVVQNKVVPVTTPQASLDPLEIALKQRLDTALLVFKGSDKWLHDPLLTSVKATSSKYGKVMKKPISTYVPILEELEALAPQVTAEAIVKDRIKPRLESLESRVKAVAADAKKESLDPVQAELTTLSTILYAEAETRLAGVEKRVRALELETAKVLMEAQQKIVDVDCKNKEDNVAKSLRELVIPADEKRTATTVTASSLEFAKNKVAQLGATKKPDTSMKAELAYWQKVLAKKAEFERLDRELQAAKSEKTAAELVLKTKKAANSTFKMSKRIG